MKVEVQQVFISTAAIFRIGYLWFNFNTKVFTTVCSVSSVPFSQEKHVSWKEPLVEERFMCQGCFVSFSDDRGLEENRSYARLGRRLTNFLLEKKRRLTYHV